MDSMPVAPGDYWAIVKRRKWSWIVTAVFVMAVAAAVAFLMPSIYQSYSTIMIEEQHIPSDFVMTTVSTYAEQRVENIKQRVLSFSQLWKIINQFKLYPDLVAKWTPEEVVDKMREDIKVETISAEMVDRRTGRPTAVTTAFTLLYEGRDPRAVLRVADTLTSLFLEQNLQARQKQVKETTEFLSSEGARVKIDLSAVESKIADFKKAHINELPELLQVNMQSLSAIERTVERLNNELRSLKEREGYLQAQLASMPAHLETTAQINRDQEKLSTLKLQLTSLQQRYSDEYPDVRTVKAQIQDLEKRIAASDQQPQNAAGNLPDNPAYITIQSQLASTRADIKSTKNQMVAFEKKAVLYRDRIEATPKVEESYKTMLSRRDSLEAKFDDLMHKHQEARVAQELEKEQKGERFTLIEPARFPEKPVKPNRLAILLIGFVLAIGAGVGMAALREFSDQSIRSEEGLAALTRVPVLAGIPTIVTARERRRKRLKYAALCVSILLVIGGGVAAFHYYVMDLNVFWAKVMRKMARL